MEKVINDFSWGLFFWQFFIFLIFVTFCYILFLVIKKLKKQGLLKIINSVENI